MPSSRTRFVSNVLDEERVIRFPYRVDVLASNDVEVEVFDPNDPDSDETSDQFSAEVEDVSDDGEWVKLRIKTLQNLTAGNSYRVRFRVVDGDDTVATYTDYRLIVSSEAVSHIDTDAIPDLVFTKKDGDEDYSCVHYFFTEPFLPGDPEDPNNLEAVEISEVSAFIETPECYEIVNITIKQIDINYLRFEGFVAADIVEEIGEKIAESSTTVNIAMTMTVLDYNKKYNKVESIKIGFQ